jgi:hypothetical protein
MALTWDVTGVENAWSKTEKPEGNEIQFFQIPFYEEGGQRYEMNEMLHYALMSTMTVGIAEITNKNYTKFYNRVIHLNQVRCVETHASITLEAIKKCIGLKTNAEILTKSQFVKRSTKFLDL